MKRIPLEQLLQESKKETYADQYRYVCDLIAGQKIKEVKTSPLNGKTPALHTGYWLLEEAPDYGKEVEELKFQTTPAIRTDYYLKHPDVYRRERKWVRLLHQYMAGRTAADAEPVSLNERSFQIWGREKFLQREEGKKILTHCGLTLEELHVYATTEPLAYYSASKSVPQTIVILENKDTFYSMRKSLLGGDDLIFGQRIGTVVYGAGKGISRSFEDFRFCVEPHINAPENEILYLGDLDYEGIGIYEHLERAFASEHEIVPFVAAYEKMIQKAQACGMDFLPETSDRQNRNISGRFFRYFTQEMTAAMQQILSLGKYIPQEIIRMTDFL